MRWALGLTAWVLAAAIGAAEDGPVLPLLEDNAAELLPKLTNPTGDPGEGHIDEKVVFSGKSSIRIVPMQRFNNIIPGWDYRIREKPAPGEYRYLRFAWKAPGCSGVMLQLHDTDWHIRYTSGGDKYGWGTKYLAEKPPDEWKLQTVDLWKDFGDRNLHGLALTAFDGEAAWFDHIYLGRTLADLDRIDATGLKRGELALSAEELERHWNQLTSSNDAAVYLALWTLVAAGEPARKFLSGKLSVSDATPGPDQFRQWIAQLDDDEFAIREKALRELKVHRGPADELLQAALATASAEAKFRLEQILKEAPTPRTAEDLRREQGQRVLGYLRERAKR